MPDVLPTPDPDAWMRRCLELALRGAGAVSPNPLVGAVVVDARGEALGEGWHARYGGPHAEVHAIEEAERRHGPAALTCATLYVNLEPCAHFGKTPPCADLILRKGIPRVVVGMEDPFPEVAGRGLARLRDAGVEVVSGVLAREAFRLNEAFVHHLRTGRPLVTLKTAATLDGRIATRSGDARWISGEASRRLVHAWRAALDGVLVGGETALRDDPALTVRHVEGRAPARVVLDRAGRLPGSLRLFSDALAHLTVAAVAETVRPAYADALEARGGRVLAVPEREGGLDLVALLERLGREGGPGGRPMQSLLVEGGSRLASAFFRAELVDRFCLFLAPKLLGSGMPLAELPAVERMSEAQRFAEHQWTVVGEDVLFTGFVRPAD